MPQATQIDSESWYGEGDLTRLLELPPTTMPRCRRAGQIRFAKRGRKTFYLGQWIVDWLIGADSRKRTTTNGSSDDPDLDAAGRGSCKSRGVTRA